MLLHHNKAQLMDRGAALIPAAFLASRRRVGHLRLPPTSLSFKASRLQFPTQQDKCSVLGYLRTKMPFAQLVLGSPGAGKSTYCDGSKLV